MAEAGEDAAAVEAEAVVLISIVVVMRSVHMVVAVVLVEEMMTGIIAYMAEAGGLEAEVLDVGGDEVEAREQGGEVQLEKVVLKEGLRLSNGTGKRSRQILVIRLITVATMMTGTMMIGMAMALLQMEVNIVILSSTKRVVITTKGSSGILMVCSYALF